jgi:hypothetical protein
MNNNHRLEFFAGLASGVAVGIFYSRSRTPALQKLVARTTKDTIHDVKQYATDLADSATEMASKGKARVVRRREALIDAFDAGLKAYHKAAG